MIVCHCNVLTVEDIEHAVDEILAAAPLDVITPSLVYHHLGTRGRCCGCFPAAVEVIGARIEKRLATADLEERRRLAVERDIAARQETNRERAGSCG